MTTVAIIGAGLGGTALARALKRAGATPIIYEASEDIASGASGNDLGTVNPRFTAYRTPESDYFTSAFTFARTTFDAICHPERSEGSHRNEGDPSIAPLLQDDSVGNPIDWDPCGALHLITDEKKEKRYPQTLQNWGWDRDHMRMVTKEEATDIAGIDIEHDALYLPGAGYVSPRKLCETYSEGVDIHFNTKIENINDLDADAIVITSGPATKNFKETEFLPINTVRGQVTQINETHISKHLKCNLHYGGYLAKPSNGVHMLGATFQPWLDHTKIILEDNQENIDKMGEFIPALKGDYEVVGHRASLRATSKDHFPIAGRVPGEKSLYVSAAHGSHGIISTLMAAELLTDMILERPHCLPLETINSLSPSRFL